MFSVLPFTVVAILPLQRRILAMDHGSAAVMVRSMLPRWGRLHAVRVGLGLTGSFPFLWAAL
jgi:hypothetical protein